MSALYLTTRIRDIERRALVATANGELMARAAAAVADACAELLRDLPHRTPALALVGPGNNGGDALLAVAMLRNRGFEARALALTASAPIAADADRVRQGWLRDGGTLASIDSLDDLLAMRPLIVDGMFGIGLARPLPADATLIVERIRALELPVVSVDVPSGIDADRGSLIGAADGDAVAVRATLTVTMIGDKPGLHTGIGASHAGRVIVAPLGIDSVVAGDSVPADGQLIDGASFPRLPIGRGREAHKGRFGDVLVVGGSAGMRGAALLAALGAQAVGAGRVFVGRIGRDTAGDLDPLHPELMIRSLGGGIAADAIVGDSASDAGGSASDALGSASAIAIGCGLGTGTAARRVLSHAIGHPATLVIDADALNILSADDALRVRLAGRPPDAQGLPEVILTPHPLEAARLLGSTTAAVQNDRIAAACAIAARTGTMVVLKGAGTVVAAPDGAWTINRSGGPILAVAGTGDVLAGVIAGLVALGLDSPTAARFGTWLHGAAGDALAGRPPHDAGIGLQAAALSAAIREQINRFAAARC